MIVRKAGGRTYSDPDILTLLEASGGLLDPYSLVRHEVNSLLKQLENFEVDSVNAFQRVCILASLAGLQVEAMSVARVAQEDREAVLMYTNGVGRKGVIFFNPNRPRARVVFSVAHEIIHSFFPTTRTGARFRAICREGSRSGRELEMLCHFGASELTMPRADFLAAVDRWGFSLSSVDAIREGFGTSFEACVYRMCQAAPFPAAGGLFQFRRRPGEEEHAESGELFPIRRHAPEVPQRKYRRQSFYYSETFPRDLIIPWNKSIPKASCVYEAARTKTIARGYEVIPVNGRDKAVAGFLEAISAPYQPDGVDPDWPDVLFILRARLL